MEAAAKVKEGPPVYGKCLLLVEDNPEFRLVLAEVFCDEGFDVIEAENGDAAVDLLRRINRIDILVTDIQMPGVFDGNAVATEAKRHYPGLPVLYMSGYPDSLTNSLAPVDAFVSKPFSPRRLLVEISGLLAAAGSDSISYRFDCRNEAARIAKSQKIALSSDADAMAHAADLLKEGFVNVEIIHGAREVAVLSGKTIDA